MSCYNREKGEILLPASAVSTLKRAVRDAYNAEVDRRFEAAKRFKKTHGGKSFKNDSELADALIAMFPNEGDGFVWWIAPRVKKGMTATGRITTKMPLRKEFPLATTKTAVFPLFCGEASISFQDRTVTWHVEENNRAVERAHDDKLAQVFFASLDKVKWTRGTGGVILYDDEYRKDDYAGPSISSSFGPKGIEEEVWQMCGGDRRLFKKLVKQTTERREQERKLRQSGYRY